MIRRNFRPIGRFGWKGHDLVLLQGDILRLQLPFQFGGVPYRQENPGVAGQGLQQGIAPDEAGGASEEEVHASDFS